MKMNIKKFVSGTLAVATLTTMLFTSVTASDEVITQDTQNNTPANIQIHKRRPQDFKFKGRRGHGNMNMAELTEEEKQALKEKFGERKELTEEEKQALKNKFGEKKELTEEEKAAMKEKMEEKKAEMEAKMQEKEAERKAILDEKLANGEITQEQYDKMTEQKPMPHHKGKGMGRGMGKGMERGRGMGPDRCAQCGCHKTCETPEVTE